ENVINEMQRWSDFFGLSNFYFIDDNFLVNTKRACNILKQSIERNFRIGQLIGHLEEFKPEVFEFLFDFIDHVGFAIESASPRIQKLINKILDLDKAIYLLEHLSNNNIPVITTNFMFGFPSETDDDIKANIEMASKIMNINKKIRIIPYIYTPQPKDDILPMFDGTKNMEFTFETLSHFDLAPNRSNFLSQEIRPWMSKEDIQFYLDLNLVWFYHFDHVVRNSQDIDVEEIYERNEKVAKLFKSVPHPSGDG
ncbi:MAG: radical SAM protein, partial [Candidatus Kariarchaeaceae archaeon]